jgi:hypothetical protein
VSSEAHRRRQGNGSKEAMAFVPGYDKYMAFELTGQGTATQFNVTGWDEKESITDLDVTHTGTAGITARIRGLLDNAGTVDLNFDTSVIPWTQSNQIRAGNKGVFTFFMGTTNPFLIPAIITEVGSKSVVNGLVTVNIAFKLDALSGTYTPSS